MNGKMPCPPRLAFFRFWTRNKSEFCQSIDNLGGEMKAYISGFLFCMFVVYPFCLQAEDLIEVEHLWVTQNVHIAGDALCQDGQYLYFKDQASCGEFYDKQKCSATNLVLSPITFIEKIELPNGNSVSHFYEIQTDFEWLRYELVEDTPIKNYELVEAKKMRVPLCSKMSWQPKKKIRNIRPARMNEISFLQGLVESGVPIINSPFGRFDPQSFLYNNSNVLDLDRPKIKSPLCNSKVNYKDLVEQASGEWSGNGIVKVEALGQWHKDSLDLYMQKTKKEDGEEHFEFFCLNEVEDV